MAIPHDPLEDAAHTIPEDPSLSVDAEHPPEATIADTSPPAWMDDAALPAALARLRAALPDSVPLDIAQIAPDKTIDEVLVDLYESDLIDKSLFIRAHTSTDVEVGELLPTDERYRSLGFIDEGGVGEIYVAKDLVLRRKVAVKQIKSEKSDSLVTRDRFLREAQITAQLDHPNIIPIYSYEVDGAGEAVSYAMKLIRGITLQTLIKRCTPEQDDDTALRERLELFLKICDALSYAHAKNIIHRDLKPENIMVGSFGEVYVMDWGLARRAVVRAGEETKIPVVGTPFYMSPEQAGGSPSALDPRSDVYALGLILFELCTLKRAIPGENSINVLFAAIKGEKLPFQHQHPKRKLSADLAALVAHATQLAPEARYASATEVGDELRAYLRGEALRVRPDNTLRKISRWVIQHRQLALILLTALILLSAGAIIWSLASQKATIEQAKLREERITAWQSIIASHASEIDRKLLRIEQMTQRLGRATLSMLEQPPTTTELSALLFHDDVDSGALQPPEFQPSSAYAMSADFHHPFYDLAPGLSPDNARDTLLRLSPLARTFQQIFLDYRYPRPRDLNEPEVLTSLREESVPLRWAYIGFESGLFVAYPGTPGYPQGYDPRVRPWYKAALEGQGAVIWGQPYYGVQTHRLGLPALMAIMDDQHRLVGVASLEILVERLIDSVLIRAGNDKGLEMALLDAQGNVVTTSASLGVDTQHSERIDALVPEPYQHTEVVQAVREKRSGYIELEVDGEPHFIGFQRLPTLGWYYVEEVHASALLGSPAATH